MISIVGVNDISLSLHKRLKDSILVGPYKEKLSPSHRNEGITYLTLPYVIPRECKTIVDLTFNTITSLVINDFALKSSKKLISVLRYDNNVIVKSISKNSCVRCLLEEKKDLSNYLVINYLAPDIETLLNLVLTSLSSGESFSVSGNDVVKLNFTKGCNSCIEGNYKFLEEEYGEIINENCGNNSSGVFPIDDRNIDIPFINRILRKSGIEILEENEDYTSFLAEGKKVFLFKNGRAMIFGTRSKEETEYLFRKYVGN
ncbi:MAG: hypothetical protein ABDH28_07975 [Brevinematia bacterium]